MGGECVDIYAAGGLPGGPGVQLYGCHGAANEKFTFEQSGHLSSQGQVCLAGRAERPSGDGGIELWMKPVGGGKIAAFLMNSGSDVTATMNLSDIGIKGGAKVRDIWEK